MFSRVLQRPVSPDRAIRIDQPDEFHGHLYCAAKAVHRAARHVASAAEADYLFTAMANLARLADVASSPDLDAADIVRWKNELAERCAELRRQSRLQAAAGEAEHAVPTVQLGPAVSRVIRQRATA